DELFTIFIAPVQINGPEQCLQNISVDIIAEIGFWNPAFHKIEEVQIFAQLIKVLSAYNFRPHFSKVAFVPFRDLQIKIFGNYGSEHGIAEEFQPFVVHGVAFLVPYIGGPVHKGLFIDFELFWLKSQYFYQPLNKFPILFGMGSKYIGGKIHVRSADFFKDDASVMAPKSESIAQSNINFPFLGLVKCQI